MVATIAAVTAFSFVVSGTVNWLAFRSFWSINYFSIATPQDIVIAGFAMTALIVIASLALAAATAFIFIAGSVVYTAVHKPIDHGKAVAFWQVMLADKTKGPVESVFLLFVACLLLSTVGCTIMLAFVLPSATEFYDTGLAVSYRSDLPKNCHGEPVAWMGSQAAIVNCGGIIRVERDFERLQVIAESSPALGR